MLNHLATACSLLLMTALPIITYPQKAAAAEKPSLTVTEPATVIAMTELLSKEAALKEASSNNGQIIVAYDTVSDPFHQILRTAMQEMQPLEPFMTIISDRFMLPRDITLSLRECGYPNASYNPESSEIEMCYELLDKFIAEFSTVTDTNEQAIAWALYAFTFVTFHEMGHAMINDLNLPVLGNQEDVADQLAVYLSSTDNMMGGQILAMLASYELSLAAAQETTDSPTWDWHSSSLQRSRNIICLSYGTDPSQYADMPESLLPITERSGCAAESQRVFESLERLLQPYKRS